MPKINPRALPHVLPVKIAEAEAAKQKKLPSPLPEFFPDWKGSVTFRSFDWYKHRMLQKCLHGLVIETKNFRNLMTRVKIRQAVIRWVDWKQWTATGCALARTT